MRVIAGIARGRTLRAPRSETVRPTADLVKGVIFSMLEAEAYKRGIEPDEEGALGSGLAWPRVADLFAGSGALGIEALSRGAREALFVEQDAEAVRAIESNLRLAGLAERARIAKTSVTRALARVEGSLDAVFLDPPYDDQPTLDAALEALARPGLLVATSVVVLEQAATAPVPPPQLGPLGLLRQRRHGRTRVTIYGGPRA